MIFDNKKKTKFKDIGKGGELVHPFQLSYAPLACMMNQ